MRSSPAPSWQKARPRPPSIATGLGTRLAEIARLTTLTAKPSTPLTLELHRVVRTIAVIAVGVGGTFFVLSMLLGNSLSDGFVFAIGVTVALVPEALLPTVTLSLAWGAEQMAKRNVLVRDLEAVETLGSTTFICTDKTGTLTRNQMAVVEVWTPVGTAMIDGAGYEPNGSVVLVDDRMSLANSNTWRSPVPAARRATPSRSTVCGPRTAIPWKRHSTCSRGGSGSTPMATASTTSPALGSRSTRVGVACPSWSVTRCW